MQSLIPRILIRIAMLPVFVYLAILLPAGTTDFWQVYAYFGSLLVLMAMGMIYFLKHDPALLERRMKTHEQENTQKILIVLLGVCVLFSYVIPGFDRRFGWSDIPIWLVLVADGIMISGYLLTMLVAHQNSFAARTIEVEEGQKLVDKGTYSVVRHPMYLGALLMFMSAPIALGSWWALLAVVPIPLVLAMRAINEEQVLLRDLPGYKDYVKKVRWRLIPAIW